MNRDNQTQLAEHFRARHRRKPLLLLPNAWDPISARLFAAAGFDAVATTSAGVAWALGYPDGQQAPWTDVVAATARIVRTVQLPVTADIEQGYGETLDQLAQSITDIIGAGAIGINIEDGTKRAEAPLRSLDEAVERIRAVREAARAAGVPIVMNARTDLYLLNLGEERERFEESVRRGKAYLAAGADCVYPIGLVDPRTIGDFVEAVAAPVNIIARAGLPSVTELGRLGVARVSTATGLTLLAMAGIRRSAEELRTSGRFDLLAEGMKHGEAQQLFSRE
jgi:2-methylisocitrate lyase-like PEP mutase family enzyme